ncbi:MAG TPA: lactate racemase domain-containing protein, partial [Anaerolineae bacterium]|nr:lactate racemase domain-containing protein [Anaerolineae bacterium]
MLDEQTIERILADGLNRLPLNDQRVLVIIPDATRTMPLPLFFRLIVKQLRPRVQAVDFLVALGTHPAMSDEALLKLVGLSAAEKAAQYADVQLLNHAWKDPDALTSIGTIRADEIAQLSNGLLKQEVPVRLNRLILDYDHLLICGPVFPHEVVGFSGGNKYFFPGIAGADIIDFTHWLGALITSYEIIGTPDTPVRRVIDRAASFIPRPRQALCSVITPEGVAGLFCGTPEEAWRAAADLSAQVHVRYVERPYRQVLSVMPEMYDEIWVGAKGMYKLEPVVADGGELIIYAPHIKEISVVHGALIRQVGYHVRDYFVKQWDQFKHIPWGVLAHSTHLRGVGTFENGIERPRIQVTLATGIPAEECHAVNLGYRDPATIDPQAWLRDTQPDR